MPLESKKSIELRSALHKQWEADGGAQGARKRARINGDKQERVEDNGRIEPVGITINAAVDLINQRKRQLVSSKYSDAITTTNEGGNEKQQVGLKIIEDDADDNRR